MTREQRKAWEKGQRRDRIVDRAQEIFFEKGFDGATIDDIAAAAGYSKRSIYLYFRDREELFLAVVVRGQELLFDTLSRAMEAKGPHNPGLMVLAKAFFDFSLSHPEFFVMIMTYESRIHPYRGTDPLKVPIRPGPGAGSSPTGTGHSSSVPSRMIRGRGTFERHWNRSSLCFFSGDRCSA